METNKDDEKFEIGVKNGADPSDTESIKIEMYDNYKKTMSVILKPETVASEICAEVKRFGTYIANDEIKFYSLVMVVSVFSSLLKCMINCIRTLLPVENVDEVRLSLIRKLTTVYSIPRQNIISSDIKWYFKDSRTAPIEFEESSKVIGEYDSDDEEEEKDIKPPDVPYLMKASRQGYLLKRSSIDANLWRKYYCVLLDKLWCLSFENMKTKGKSIKLNGLTRYRGGNSSVGEQMNNIIINSGVKTHYFRSINSIDYQKWINDLTIMTSLTQDNNMFSMAEIIICDEESIKYDKLAKNLKPVLDNQLIPLILDNTTLQNRNYSAHPTIEYHKGEDGNEKNGLLKIDSMVSMNSEISVQSEETRKNRLKTIGGSSYFLAPSLKYSSSPTIQSLVAERYKDIYYLKNQAYDTVKSNLEGFLKKETDLNESWPNSLYLPISDISMEQYLPSVSFLHRLHNYNHSCSDIVAFQLSVLQYLDLFRHDLRVTRIHQKIAAIAVYVRYILPQLQLIGINQPASPINRKNEEDMTSPKAYVSPYHSHNPSREMIKSNSSTDIRKQLFHAKAFHSSQFIDRYPTKSEKELRFIYRQQCKRKNPVFWDIPENLLSDIHTKLFKVQKGKSPKNGIIDIFSTQEMALEDVQRSLTAAAISSNNNSKNNNHGALSIFNFFATKTNDYLYDRKERHSGTPIEDKNRNFEHEENERNALHAMVNTILKHKYSNYSKKEIAMIYKLFLQGDVTIPPVELFDDIISYLVNEYTDDNNIN